MKLLSKAIAEKIFEELAADSEPISRDIIKDIAEEKDKIVRTAIGVVIFLFTTLTIISLAIFDNSSKDLSFFGVKIANKDVFVFTAFMVSNALYVVSTGMFIKLLICEFLIANIVKYYYVEDGKKFQAFLRTFHANILTFALSFNVIPKKNKMLRYYLSAINIYSKYVMLISYGVYYYIVLIYFMNILYYGEKFVLLTILFIVNIFSFFTTLAVFIFVPERSNIGLQFYKIRRLRQSLWRRLMEKRANIKLVKRLKIRLGKEP